MRRDNSFRLIFRSVERINGDMQELTARLEGTIGDQESDHVGTRGMARMARMARMAPWYYEKQWSF